MQASSQQGRSPSAHTGIGTMMQMWQEEKSLEQPYNNVGSYTTKTGASTGAQKVADGIKSGDPGKHTSAAFNASGAGSRYPDSRY